MPHTVKFKRQKQAVPPRTGLWSQAAMHVHRNKEQSTNSKYNAKNKERAKIN